MESGVAYIKLWTTSFLLSNADGVWNFICNTIFQFWHWLDIGKYASYPYTDDSAMTLAIANSLVRQRAAVEEVHKFDAKDMAKGYSSYSLFPVISAQLLCS